MRPVSLPTLLARCSFRRAASASFHARSVAFMQRRRADDAIASSWRCISALAAAWLRHKARLRRQRPTSCAAASHAASVSRLRAAAAASRRAAHAQNARSRRRCSQWECARAERLRSRAAVRARLRQHRSRIRSVLEDALAATAAAAARKRRCFCACCSRASTAFCFNIALRCATARRCTDSSDAVWPAAAAFHAAKGAASSCRCLA